jgi:hypothetical protein
MLNIGAPMFIFGRSHIENVNSRQKMTDTIVFLGEPAVRLCKKVRCKWSGNWYKITSNLLLFAPSCTAVHKPIVKMLEGGKKQLTPSSSLGNLLSDYVKSSFQMVRKLVKNYIKLIAFCAKLRSRPQAYSGTCRLRRKTRFFALDSVCPKSKTVGVFLHQVCN